MDNVLLDQLEGNQEVLRWRMSATATPVPQVMKEDPTWWQCRLPETCQRMFWLAVPLSKGVVQTVTTLPTWGTVVAAEFEVTIPT